MKCGPIQETHDGERDRFKALHINPIIYLDNTHLYWSLISAAGMMLVAIASVLSWRSFTGLSYRWFCVGAALWLSAVALKHAIEPIDAVFFPWLVRLIPPPVLTGSLYVGLETR